MLASSFFMHLNRTECRRLDIFSFRLACKTWVIFLRILDKQRRKAFESEARVASEGRCPKKLTPARKPLFKLFRPQAQPKRPAYHRVKKYSGNHCALCAKYKKTYMVLFSALKRRNYFFGT